MNVASYFGEIIYLCNMNPDGGYTTFVTFDYFVCLLVQFNDDVYIKLRMLFSISFALALSLSPNVYAYTCKSTYVSTRFTILSHMRRPRCQRITKRKICFEWWESVCVWVRLSERKQKAKENKNGSAKQLNIEYIQNCVCFFWVWNRDIGKGE